MNIPCDLHIHTTFSDGHYTPTQVVQKAIGTGIKVMAITDHDTIAGVEEAIAAAQGSGITCLAGIEFSTYQKEEVHILGYNLPYHNIDFLDQVAQLQHMRKKRIVKVVDKLHRHGIKLVVHDELDGPTAGRSHVAELLVKQGFVRSKAEAFDKYIGKGAPCYVEGMRIAPKDAVRLIVQYGGVPVLAHPLRFSQSGEIATLLDELVPAGLMGIEVHYPCYSPTARATLRQYARQYGLIITGGSDFHSTTYGADIGSSGAYLDDKAQKTLLLRQ